MSKVIVQIASKVYQMTEKELAGVLKIACEQVPFGIYAIRKGNQVELAREKNLTTTQLKQKVRDLKAAGYKVYYNKGK